MSRAERFAEPKLRRQMEITLDEVRSGKFAQEWASEYASGYPRLETLLRKRGTLALWALEEQAIRTLRERDPAIRLDIRPLG